RSCSFSFAVSWPKISMLPRAGVSNPTTTRSSTDLPVPEPPTTPSTSPRRTSRSRLRWIERPPNRVLSPRTRMIGSPASSMPWADSSGALSDMQVGEDDREAGVEHDHQEDRLDDRDGGEASDALGALRHLEALIAADHRDDGGEER